jgi:hypothetical protein
MPMLSAVSTPRLLGRRPPLCMVAVRRHALAATGAATRASKPALYAAVTA